MTKSYLIISLGPVQDFIASARKCRDLWFGSDLLSDLARRVADTLMAHTSPDVLVFPSTDSLDKRRAVANKIVALVDTEQIEALVVRARRACLDALRERFDEIKSRIGRGGAPFVDFERAWLQLDDLIECFAVAVPIRGETDDAYDSARNRAEALMARRKRTRTWRVSGFGAPVPKSSLDGERESVVDEAWYDAAREERGDMPTALRRLGSDRLCGIGLVKRLAASQPTFHSSSHAAAASYFKRFADPETSAVVDRFLDTVSDGVDGLERGELEERLAVKAKRGIPDGRGGCLDGAMLYEGRVVALVEEIVGKLDRGEKSHVIDAVRRMRRGVGLSGDPNPYYAMLVADGDRMGSLIDSLSGFGRHRQLSKALAEFADTADQVVGRHAGSLIYAGGDDVLALLPLHTVFNCVTDLAEAFHACLEDRLGEDLGTTRGRLSVGVVVAHHVTHMGHVRQLAWDAEKLAKTRRDALAVILDKRSGAGRSVVGPLHPTRGDPLPARIRNWADIIARGQIPHGFIREVEDLGRRVGAFVANNESSMAEVAIAELERIMMRKQPGQVLPPGLEECLKQQVRSSLCERQSSGESLIEAIQSLAVEMTLALEIHRIEEQAGREAVL